MDFKHVGIGSLSDPLMNPILGALDKECFNAATGLGNAGQNTNKGKNVSMEESHETDPIEADVPCQLCPHKCGAVRGREAGRCGVSTGPGWVKLGRAAIHKWEEPCVSGWDEEEDKRGSGAVFFSGCPMGCAFCQNHKISWTGYGAEITTQELSDTFLSLQGQGAYNINLVSPTPYQKEIIIAVAAAREKGLKIPIVWNSNGYERLSTIQELEGTVDIWLPDFKYFSEKLGESYSGVLHYTGIAEAAIAEMVRQQPIPTFDEDKMMTKGVIVRHLVLPTHSADSKRVLNLLYNKFKDSIYFSILNQYTPVGKLDRLPHLNRKVTKQEYEAVVNHAINIGIENGFLQSGECANEGYIPSFDLTGIKPSQATKPLPPKPPPTTWAATTQKLAFEENTVKGRQLPDNPHLPASVSASFFADTASSPYAGTIYDTPRSTPEQRVFGMTPSKRANTTKLADAVSTEDTSSAKNEFEDE